MNSLQFFLTLFGGSATSILILGYLCRSLLSQWLAKDIEKYKSELKTQTEKEATHLSHNLELKALEHQVRFSALHQKRAEVLAELNQKLVEAYESAKAFVSPLELQGDRNKDDLNLDASKRLYDLHVFFEKNRIYLPQPTCDLLSKFISDVRRPVVQFGLQLGMEKYGRSDPDRKLQVWMEAVDLFDKELPLARARVEHDFREILGDTTKAG